MSQDITTVIKAISEFGILIIIAAIFLYVIIRVINIFLKSLESKVMGSKHDKALDVRTRVNEKVNYLIEDFLEESGGDRIQVVEFSNSVTSVAYLPFKYMNCTYEVYSMDKTATARNIDKLTTSLFTTFLTHLYRETFCIVDTTKPDRSLGGSIYDLLSATGESRSLCAILKTASGKCIGFVMLRRDSEFTEGDIHDIQVLADKLSALLGIMDK